MNTVTLPDGPSLPRVAHGGMALVAPLWTMRRLREHGTVRKVRAPGLRLGRWTLPEGQAVLVSIYLIHRDGALFPNPHRFDPDRCAGRRPDTHQWIPFGGGARRCIGPPSPTWR